MSVALLVPSSVSLGCQCGRLDLCCSGMCQLPLHGPFGFCRQVACIAATLHVANVTNVDTLPQNVLFQEPRDAHRHGQIALFDFDIAQVDGRPAFDELGDDHLRKARLLSGVLIVLTSAASIGYEKCSVESKAATAAHERKAGINDTHLYCPFEKELRVMLPQGMLTEENFAIIRSQQTVQRQAHFCEKSKPAGISFMEALHSSMEKVPHGGVL